MPNVNNRHYQKRSRGGYRNQERRPPPKPDWFRNTATGNFPSDITSKTTKPVGFGQPDIDVDWSAETSSEYRTFFESAQNMGRNLDVQNNPQSIEEYTSKMKLIYESIMSTLVLDPRQMLTYLYYSNPTEAEVDNNENEDGKVESDVMSIASSETTSPEIDENLKRLHVRGSIDETSLLKFLNMFADLESDDPKIVLTKNLFTSAIGVPIWYGIGDITWKHKPVLFIVKVMTTSKDVKRLFVKCLLENDGVFLFRANSTAMNPTYFILTAVNIRVGVSAIHEAMSCGLNDENTKSVITYFQMRLTGTTIDKYNLLGICSAIDKSDMSLHLSRHDTKFGKINMYIPLPKGFKKYYLLPKAYTCPDDYDTPGQLTENLQTLLEFFYNINKIVACFHRFDCLIRLKELDDLDLIMPKILPNELDMTALFSSCNAFYKAYKDNAKVANAETVLRLRQSVCGTYDSEEIDYTFSIQNSIPEVKTPYKKTGKYLSVGSSSIQYLVVSDKDDWESTHRMYISLCMFAYYLSSLLSIIVVPVKIFVPPVLIKLSQVVNDGDNSYLDSMYEHECVYQFSHNENYTYKQVLEYLKSKSNYLCITVNGELQYILDLYKLASSFVDGTIPMIWLPILLPYSFCKSVNVKQLDQEKFSLEDLEEKVKVMFNNIVESKAPNLNTLLSIGLIHESSVLPQGKGNLRLTTVYNDDYAIEDIKSGLVDDEELSSYKVISFVTKDEDNNVKILNLTDGNSTGNFAKTLALLHGIKLTLQLEDGKLVVDIDNMDVSNLLPDNTNSKDKSTKTGKKFVPTKVSIKQDVEYEAQRVKSATPLPKSSFPEPQMQDEDNTSDTRLLDAKFRAFTTATDYVFFNDLDDRIEEAETRLEYSEYGDGVNEDEANFDSSKEPSGGHVLQPLVVGKSTNNRNNVLQSVVSNYDVSDLTERNNTYTSVPFIRANVDEEFVVDEEEVATDDEDTNSLAQSVDLPSMRSISALSNIIVGHRDMPVPKVIFKRHNTSLEEEDAFMFLREVPESNEEEDVNNLHPERGETASRGDTIFQDEETDDVDSVAETIVPMARLEDYEAGRVTLAKRFLFNVKKIVMHGDYFVITDQLLQRSFRNPKFTDLFRTTIIRDRKYVTNYEDFYFKMIKFDKDQLLSFLNG